MKQKKNKHLEDYVYFRLGKDAKKDVKARAKAEGSNMTIWLRQLILKTLQEE